MSQSEKQTVSPYDPEYRTECCGADVTYSIAFEDEPAVLCCRACYKEVWE